MKFETKKSEIDEFLHIGAAIAERRQTIPILSNLKIVAKNNTVEITATDLEIQAIIKTDVNKVIEEGATTVSARKMSELCRSLPENEILEFTLVNGKLTVKSKNFHADFATLSSDDFPMLETSEESIDLSLPSSLLKRLLIKTQFCMASQDVRYYLNGLLIEHKNSKFSAVSTDGHRLALAHTELNLEGGNEIRVILPRKAVLEISKILPQDDSLVEISIGSTSVRIKQNNLDFTTKLIDGKFPDYEKVFPEGDSQNLSILKESLLSALLRASVLSNEKYKGVRFALESNLLRLTANNPEQELAEETLEVEYSGSNMEIGFNIGYLLDVLNSIENEKVELLFYNQESSCLIKEPDNNSEIYVIMPMRL